MTVSPYPVVNIKALASFHNFTATPPPKMNPVSFMNGRKRGESQAFRLEIRGNIHHTLN